jgi:hypothetical protein
MQMVLYCQTLFTVCSVQTFSADLLGRGGALGGECKGPYVQDMRRYAYEYLQLAPSPEAAIIQLHQYIPSIVKNSSVLDTETSVKLSRILTPA